MLQFPSEKKNRVWNDPSLYTPGRLQAEIPLSLRKKALLLVKVSKRTLIVFVKPRCKHLPLRTTDMHNLIA